MGRAPCCSKIGLHRGPWTPREDTLLTKYIEAHGEGNWRSLPKKAGLLRCGKSCRLRWLNYLRPDIKRGNISSDEDDLIIRLHVLLGNRWSLIAGRLPGRTDNEIKNYWNTHLTKKLRSQGIDPETHKPLIPREQDQATTETTSKKNKLKRRKLSSAVAIGNNNAASNPTKNKHQTKNKNSTIDDQDHDDDEKNKHTVHLPKPVRIRSFSVLPRNDSFMSNITSDAGAGAGAGIFIGEAERGYSGDNDYNMMTDGSGDIHLGFDDDQYNLCPPDYQDDKFFGDHQNNFNKMFDEYMQVLKTSSKASEGSANMTDDDDLFHLDSSFAETFLD